MNKKEYEKPATRVVKIAMTSIICTSGNVTNVDGVDTGIGYGGGGSGPAHARSFGDWDE